MSDTNQQEKDNYVNFNMLNLFKSLIHEILTKEIGVEISLEDYNNLSDEEKSSGNYFIKDAGPVNEFSQILDTLSQIESNEEQYRYVGALAIKELLANIILKTDVVDHFLSTATKLPLSANMGRVLNEKKADLITNVLSSLSSEFGTIESYNISKIGNLIYMNLRMRVTKIIPINSRFILGIPQATDNYGGFLDILSIDDTKQYLGYVHGNYIASGNNQIPIGTYQVTVLYR